MKSIVFLMKYFIILCSILASLFSIAQEPAIGFWRDHLPYNKNISVAAAENLIYCASENSLFSYNQDDNSIERHSKISGLSDNGIKKLAYNKEAKALLIAYSNGNIDIIHDDDIINMADITRKPTLINKTINDIMFIGPNAYLSCGFGIVVIDLKEMEVIDSYIIGPSGQQIVVNDVVFDGDSLYAATEEGIYSADINANNLADYKYWNRMSGLPDALGNYNQIAYFEDQLVISQKISGYGLDSIYTFDGNQWIHFISDGDDDFHDIYANDTVLIITKNYSVTIINQQWNQVETIFDYNTGTPEPREVDIDQNGLLWIADLNYSLVRHIREWVNEFVSTSGPHTVNTYEIEALGEHVWATTGGHNNAWNKYFRRDGVLHFDGTKWYNINDQANGFDSLTDILFLAIDPSDHNHAFAGSYGNGLLEFRGNEVIAHYNETNSSLHTANFGYYFLGASGIQFDYQNNLWVANSGVSNALSVLEPNGSWTSFNLSPYITDDVIGDLFIDSYNQKWIILARGNGIVVFYDNQSIDNPADDKKRRITNSLGSGNLPSNDVHCIAEDQDGEIWFGTADGIAVMYTPGNLFGGQFYDAQTILVEQDGLIAPLLEGETVTSIVIDGSNKKWIGTQSAGAFLLSEDGTEQILHFTKESSPLLSNNIIDIAITPDNGEVFFATDKGIISYKSQATQGVETQAEVLVFPNPVRPTYTGKIAIRGLVTNADIKITDIAGNVVFAAVAEGGQAVWNGTNLNGEKVSTGIYLVLSSNFDGSETVVAKIAFIK